MENKPALLTKATFCKALRMIKEQDTINDEVAAALGKVSDGCYTFGCNNKWFDALMMVLKEAVNDRYNYVEWWLYEATDDCKVWENKEGGKEWCLKEPESLYDYGLYYGVSIQRQATIGDIRKAVKLMDNNFEDSELIIKAKAFGVERYEIHSNTKGIPDAILLTDNVKHHQLAISLVPPPTLCKISEPKPFQDIPTIAIHMGTDFDLHHMKSDEVKIRLRDKVDDKKWISSPAIEAWLLKNLARQHEYYEKYLAEEQTQKQALEKENAGREKMRAKADNAQITHLSPHQLSSEELQKISQMLEAKHSIIPNERVVDDAGRRWCFCDICHRWKPDTFMVSYGGTGDRVNRGLCSECSRKQS